MRSTPFGLVFGEIATERFPAIGDALRQAGSAPADRDQFVLLEPVARLLRDIVPDSAGAEALEAHLLLLHHAYLHWAGEGWVYNVGEQTLNRSFRAAPTEWPAGLYSVANAGELLLLTCRILAQLPQGQDDAPRQRGALEHVVPVE